MDARACRCGSFETICSIKDRWLEASRLYAQVAATIRAYRCRYCGGPAETFDHIQPRVRGGTNDHSNLVAACRACNNDKKDRPLMEWLRATGRAR